MLFDLLVDSRAIIDQQNFMQ